MLQTMDTIPPTVPLRVQSRCVPVHDGIARANKELTNDTPCCLSLDLISIPTPYSGAVYLLVFAARRY